MSIVLSPCQCWFKGWQHCRHLCVSPSSEFWSDELFFSSHKLYWLFPCWPEWDCSYWVMQALDGIFLLQWALGGTLLTTGSPHTYGPTPLTEGNHPAVPGFVHGCSNPQHWLFVAFLTCVSFHPDEKRSCLDPDFIGYPKKTDWSCITCRISE